MATHKRYLTGSGSFKWILGARTRADIVCRALREPAIYQLPYPRRALRHRQNSPIRSHLTVHRPRESRWFNPPASTPAFLTHQNAMPNIPTETGPVAHSHHPPTPIQSSTSTALVPKWAEAGT